MTEYNKLYEVPIHLEGYDPTYKGHQGQIKKAATLIKKCETSAHHCRCRVY